MEIKVKRIYEKPEAHDGIRVLVDRIWPRGVSKERAEIDHWLKQIGPSTELRKWFGHNPEKFPEFKKMYKEELKNGDGQKALQRLKQVIAKNPQITLLYAAKDKTYNHVKVIKEILLEEIGQ